MKVRLIQVNISQTINLGNYESVKFSAGLEAEVNSEQEDISDCFIKAFDIIKDELEYQIGKIEEKGGLY